MSGNRARDGHVRLLTTFYEYAKNINYSGLALRGHRVRTHSVSAISLNVGKRGGNGGSVLSINNQPFAFAWVYKNK